MIIPYGSEVLITRWPFSNLAIMGGCIASFVVLLAGGFSPPVLEAMILDGWSPAGLFGHQFIHAGLLHLAFNMLYLFVFGNAVCDKIGNLTYAATFLLAGAVAGGLHIIMDGAPAVGASGAINAVIGLHLVLHPINRIHCFYFFFIRFGTFEIKGFWLILFWFLVDAWRALSGAETGIAYWAHVGGFLFGFGLGLVYLRTGVATMSRHDNPTLLDYMTGLKRDGSRPRPAATAEQAGGLATHRAAATMAGHAAVTQDINLDCPHCAQNLDVPEEMMGEVFSCPACAGVIQLEEE